MADRFCPNCGTEVDADARFCPACGGTLDPESAPPAGPDDQPTAAIPPAPEWPQRSEPADSRAVASQPASGAAPSAPPAAEQAPTTGPTADGPRASDRGPDLPITVPVMLSGWLIGVGSGLAALSLLPRLGGILNILLLVALLGIAASIFLADRLPGFAYQRLAILVVVMVALGVALDRAAFTVRAVDLIFLATILVAAGGVLLIELGRDRPMSPPGGSG